MDAVLTVGELTRRIRSGLESRFPFVWVRGEVGNISRPSSGHLYFSLKDGEGLLHCVWFRNRQRDDEEFDPLTGEVFPEGPRPGFARCIHEGREALCAGSISVYAPRGAYQLVVELARPDGLGRLALAFEELKRKLAAQGFFAPQRKRPLPPHPVRVAVITAPGGAAVRDFARIASERGYGAQVRIYPVPVQGTAAAPAIAAALDRVGAENWAQVALLIRGGGSLEDLWAFNEESVVRAVFRSSVPVLTGIGHETDTSLADMTADVRAATPSHAAQLLWPLRSELAQRLDELETLLRRRGAACLENARSRLRAFEQALRWLSPAGSLSRGQEAAARADAALQRAAFRLLREKEALLDDAGGRLADMPGKLARSPRERLEALHSRLERGFSLEGRRHLLEAAMQRLRALARNVPAASERALEACAAALRALDPNAPLERGYALVFDGAGRILRSAKNARPGDPLSLRLRDGTLHAEVVDAGKKADVSVS
jgi:exodeoxyribonuclease VII large subunit